VAVEQGYWLQCVTQRPSGESFEPREVVAEDGARLSHSPTVGLDLLAGRALGCCR